MDNNGYVNLQSRGMPVSGSEVDNLARVCSENGVDFRTTLYRMDSVQASALQPWLTLIFSPEVISKLSDVLFQELVKQAVKDLIGMVKARFGKKENDKISSIIDLQSSSAKLKIESPQISKETFDKAFETFAQVSQAAKVEDDHPVIPKFVVVDRDGKVLEVMSQQNYLWRYVVPSKTDAEDKKSGQP